LVYPDYYLIDDNDDILSIERREKLIDDSNCLMDVSPHGACTMFRRKILMELGGYSEEVTCQDGFDIWIKFLEDYKPSNINLPLFYYRQHAGSLSTHSKKIIENRRILKRNFAATRGNRIQSEKDKRLALIPARRHSNVAERLALSPIAGNPLIHYTINEAIKSDAFHRIVVVSEDDQICEHVQNAYPHVFVVKRPMKLARRNTGIEDTVKLVLDQLKTTYGEAFKEILLLHVQSPLKRSHYFIKAIDTMHIFGSDSIVSICETNSPYYIRNHHGLERIGNSEKFRLERKTIYRGNGALLLFKTDNLLRGDIFGEKIGHIIMPKEDSINICSEFDYRIAEFFIKEQADAKKKAIREI